MTVRGYRKNAGSIINGPIMNNKQSRISIRQYLTIKSYNTKNTLNKISPMDIHFRIEYNFPQKISNQYKMNPI